MGTNWLTDSLTVTDMNHEALSDVWSPSTLYLKESSETQTSRVTEPFQILFKIAAVKDGGYVHHANLVYYFRL